MRTDTYELKSITMIIISVTATSTNSYNIKSTKSVKNGWSN